VEPLHLQLVCRNLVSKLKSPRITERELADFADVDQTLADFYQRAVEATAGKSKVDEVKIRRWFDDKLITPAGTRGIVFQGKEDTEGLPNRAVDVLARERIIRREWRAGALWYELTHDRFIEPIRESNTRWREQLSQPLWLKQLVWPDDDLRNWLDSKASQILYNCALRVHLNMSKEQIVDEYLAGLKQKGAKDPSEENWRQAELYLANDVLDGKFDLVRSLTPDSYPRIEGDEGRMWLRELKALKAYLNWEARKAAPASEGQVEDYLTACQQIRDQLRNPQRKRPPDAFEPIQKYIENNFFTHGRLDCEKERTKLWIEAKKQRLLANTDKNKADAEHDAVDFMEKFYGHISSAVLGTGAKREESIRSVLQALGYCSPFEPYEAMVNCFEMAVAIAFLDHEKTGQILEEQEKTE
jgi:hypothetical protein